MMPSFASDGVILNLQVMTKVLLSAGTDEGVYAWVSANYALGTLHGDPTQTTGIVELGGASAQVPNLSLSWPLRSC